ncbi:MAG: hypothetical protein ACREAQ_07795, partial [Nitrososphaera sp.]
WLGRLEVIERQVPVTYAYFNNHYGANAPSNLLQLLWMRGELTESQEKALARSERVHRKELTIAKKLTDFL